MDTTKYTQAAARIEEARTTIAELIADLIRDGGSVPEVDDSACGTVPAAEGLELWARTGLGIIEDIKLAHLEKVHGIEIEI